MGRKRTTAAVAAGLAIVLAGTALLAWRSIASEHEAETSLVAIANRVLKPEAQLSTDRVDCDKPATSLRTFSAAFLCRIKTACNAEFNRVVYSDLLHGNYVTADPLAYNFARHCPIMLKQEALEEQDRKIDQGG
jgi:hypothetical protein